VQEVFEITGAGAVFSSGLVECSRWRNLNRARRRFWDSRAERQTREVLKMFKDFSDDEIESMHNRVLRLYNSLEPMYRELRSQ